MQLAPVGSSARAGKHGGEKAKPQQPQGQAPLAPVSAPLAPVPAPLAPVPGAGRKKRAASRDSSDSSSSTSASEVDAATFGTRSTTSSSTTVSTTTSTKAISKRHKKDRKKARRKGTRGKKEQPGFGHANAGFRKGSSSSAGTESDEDSNLKLWVFPATAIVLTILVAGAITLMLEPVDNSSSSSSVFLFKSVAPKKAEDDCPCRNGKNNTTPGNGTTSGPGSSDAMPERPRLPEASTPLAPKPERDTTTKAVDGKAAGSPEDAQRRSGVEGDNSAGARLPRGRSGPKTRSFGSYRIEKGKRKLGAKKAARTQGPEAPLGSGTPTTFVVGTVTTPEVNASRPVSAAESQPNTTETGTSKASTGEGRPKTAAEAQPGATTGDGQEDSLDEDDTERPSVEAGDEGRLGEAPTSGGEPNATQTDSRRDA